MSGEDFSEGVESDLRDEASSPPPAKHRRWRTGVVLALGAGLALTAGGVALAQGDPSPKPSAPKADEHGPRLDGPMPLGVPFLDGPIIGPPGRALHGELTVEKPDGGYETLRFQRGTVDAVSHDSISVKSDDGFTSTYVVNGDTLVDGGRDGIGSVEKGHDVGLIAVVDGDSTTARHLIDTTLLKVHFRDFTKHGRPWLELRGHVREHLRDRLHDLWSGDSAVYTG